MPPRGSGLLGDLAPLLGGELRGARSAALEPAPSPQLNGGGVFLGLFIGLVASLAGRLSSDPRGQLDEV
jgi:hypothetical protein